MKVFFTLIIIQILAFKTSAQEAYYVDVSASQIVSVMDKVGFKAKRCDNNVLASAILQMPDNVIKQLNINGWSLCNNRQEDVFRNYNLYYKPVNRTTFDLYCKELTALMICDGTYKQPQ